MVKNQCNFPVETSIGSMANYITTTNSKNFQPMNANFGIFPELPVKIQEKQEQMNNMQKEPWKQFGTL